MIERIHLKSNMNNYGRVRIISEKIGLELALVILRAISSDNW
jgi:hypothetical protein